MMADAEVTRRVARLWRQSGEWERLEASSTDSPEGGAYCRPREGRSHQTYDLLRLGPQCPGVVRELAALLEESGWTRFEVIGRWGRPPDGWCERADGSGIHLSGMAGYGDQSWVQWPAAEQVLAGKPGSEQRWAFMEGMDIGAEGDPYLDRLRIVQTPWFGVYLHHIHRPDRDADPHDHPWSFISLVLTGSYIEAVWVDKRLPDYGFSRGRRRWSLARIRRREAHIITSIEGPLWTLVFTGPRRGEWGFWEKGQFVPWREYTSRKSSG